MMARANEGDGSARSHSKLQVRHDNGNRIQGGAEHAVHSIPIGKAIDPKGLGGVGRLIPLREYLSGHQNVSGRMVEDLLILRFLQDAS